MSIDVRGLDEAVRELEGVAQRIETPTPALEAVASDLRHFIAERFRTRTAPNGAAWAALKPHTLKYRETSGALAASIYARAAGTAVRYGAEAEYAAVQHARRPFLPESFDEGPAAELADASEETIADFVLPESE